MTLLEKINSLTWYDLINKLKDILKGLIPQEPKYKVYTALLTQTGTNAPVATVLENTLGGDLVWSREDVGIYTGTLNEAFIENKTGVLLNSVDATGTYESYVESVNNVKIITISAETNEDDYLNNSFFEIKIYN